MNMLFGKKISIVRQIFSIKALRDLIVPLGSPGGLVYMLKKLGHSDYSIPEILELSMLEMKFSQFSHLVKNFSERPLTCFKQCHKVPVWAKLPEPQKFQGQCYCSFRDRTKCGFLIKTSCYFSQI